MASGKAAEAGICKLDELFGPRFGAPIGCPRNLVNAWFVNGQ